jgi:hypothetical protein
LHFSSVWEVGGGGKKIKGQKRTPAEIDSLVEEEGWKWRRMMMMMMRVEIIHVLLVSYFLLFTFSSN